MKDENACDIQLNQYGKPDIDYYLEKAHKMRSEAIFAGFRAVKTWLTQALGLSRHHEKGTAKPRPSGVQSGWPWVDLILRDTQNRTAHRT
jgi:hypothetical protein